MTWKLAAKAEGWCPLLGVPWRDMEDEEFTQVEAEYAARHQFPPDCLTTSGWFEQSAPVGTSRRQSATTTPEGS